MASLCYDFSSLRFLRCLEKSLDLKCPLRAEARSLRLKVSFLLVFLSCGGKHYNIENKRLQALLVHIRTVFRSVDLDIGRYWVYFTKISSKNSFGQLSVNRQGDLLFSALQRLELLKPDIHEVYTRLSKSSRSTIHGDSEAALKNINFLLQNINDLLICSDEMAAPIKKELKAAQKGLRCLRDLLAFTAKRCSELGKFEDLIMLAEFLAGKVSCLLYMCSVREKMNDGMVNEMKMNLSSELQRDVRQIYIKALKASKTAQGDSAVVDEFDWRFLDSLRVNVWQLPDTVSNKDQIISLHEELQFLARSFATHKSSETYSVQSLYRDISYKLDEICNYVVQRISAAIVDMGCLIYSLHNNEQNTEMPMELMRAVSDLQDVIKTLKEDVRKAYYMYTPKSLLPTTKFRTTIANGLVYLKKIYKILARIRGASIPHRFLYKELQKEMYSLTKASVGGVEHEELEILMMHLNDIINGTENLISSISHGLGTFWTHNLWLFVLIEKIKMIKMEFNLPSIRPPWTPFSTFYYPVISDDEAEEAGEQMINGSKRSHIFSIDVSMRGFEDQMRWLETNLDLISPLKDEVKEIRLSAGFLKVFLCFKGKWHVEDGILKVLLTHICVVFQNANQDLQRLWTEMIHISQKNEWCLPVNMDCLLSSVIARLQLLKPDIQEVYTILSKSSRFITGTNDEAVKENLNSLQENIEDLLRCNVELVGCVKEQLEIVRHSLRFLRNFLAFTAKRCSKLGKLKDFLIHAEFLADSMSCLLYLCCFDHKMSDWIVNELKMHPLSELLKFSLAQQDIRDIYIRALKASNSTKRNSTVMVEFDLGFLDSLRDNILELSNTNLSFNASNKNQILSLLDELKFLISFFAMDKSSEQHSEHDQMSNYPFERINAVIIDIGCVIYSLSNDEKNENMARELELNKKISAMEAIISVTKEDTRKMYDLYLPKSLRSNFPRTNGHGFVGSLVRKIKELLNTKDNLVAPLEHHIEIVQKELLSLRDDFSKISNQRSQCEELQIQWIHFLDIAYQTEYVIDSFLCWDRPLYCHKLGMFNVIEEIKTIRIELKVMEDKMTDDTSVYKPSCSSTQISEESKKKAFLRSQERLADEKSTTELVIFGEEAQKIRDQLTNRLKKIHIISIVGMPGIGKTTLAESMFQNPSVTSHFHVQARCSVSQAHDKRRLLLEILEQVSAERERDDDCDLDQKLYKSLKGRRYLIFMDDIWSIHPWEDIKAGFPDDENGSRIIFTSRLEDIASQTMLGSTTYQLSPLSKEKCWEMLQVKLFGNRSCPPELAAVGREIAANCKGLPLAVDLIAGVLRVKERKDWNEAAESLVTILLEDPQGQCRKVLELSYQNLPDDLRPCFLYFATFPEDANVPTRDLILLWVAEGFVHLRNDELKSIEDAAEDMLNNLISRCLVTVARRGPLGGVDSSRVHDLLHEFVVAKAQEESFTLKIDGKAKLHDEWREQYRLCIYPDNWVQFRESDPSGPRTRAFICSDDSPREFINLYFSTFKLLTVLYIPNVQCRYCPELFRLIHLRLLAISGIPDSDARNIILNIHKLRKLETFIMHGSRRVTEYDGYLWLDKICSMVRLRHFCTGGSIHLRYHREEIWQKASFSNLQTLYNLRASYEEDIEKILKLMPNLVDLKIVFYIPGRECHTFPKLDFLKKLKSLEVTHDGVFFNFCACKIVKFPPYLKHLVLSHYCLPWTEISDIGNLEYLEALELKGAFRGPTWDMIDGQFPKLRYLSLSGLDIEEWNASEDHLSCLEKLHVAMCRKLKELPYCLAEIGTLQTIEIFYCTEAAENSAKRIKEEQEQMGNEQLVVDITKAFWKDV